MLLMMKNSAIKIGVLDIQGSVEEHMEMLLRLAKAGLNNFPKNLHKKADLASIKPKNGVVPSLGEVPEPVLVKTVEQLKQVRGLIIPGGESTTIGKLLKRFGLRDEIISLAKSGKLAVWGTCAGAILLARKIVGEQQADSLALMDIVIERNAYGRQLDSFETEIKFDFSKGYREKSLYAGEKKNKNKISRIPAIFIRAPRIVSAGKGVKVLARIGSTRGVEIVAVRQKNLFVTSFHPELTENLETHKYFVEMCGG